MPFPCSKLSGRDGLFHFIPSLSRLSELHMAILLPRRTQWPVETTHTVHVLSVLRLLLLPDRIIPVVAGHFGVVRAAEAREAHQSLHLLRLLITAVLIVHIHRVLAARCNAIRPRQYAPRVLARARLRAARRRVRLVCLLLLMLLLLPTACRTVRGWRCASRSARRRAPSRIVPGIVRPRAPRSRASISPPRTSLPTHAPVPPAPVAARRSGPVVAPRASAAAASSWGWFAAAAVVVVPHLRRVRAAGPLAGRGGFRHCFGERLLQCPFAVRSQHEEKRPARAGGMRACEGWAKEKAASDVQENDDGTVARDYSAENSRTEPAVARD